MAKISVLGPVSPFRGGIARHTTRLARELAENLDHDVSIFSFSSLYPKLLYPGQDDRDQDASTPNFAPIRCIISSINPLSWTKAVEAIAAEKPDFVVLPAWTFFVSPALGQIAKKLRQRGIKIVQIVHNASDHESTEWKTLLTRYQLAQSDALVTHNDQIASDIRAILPDPKIVVSPHPIYDDYPAPSGKLKKEADLELLLFGLVRHYKGLDIALRALAASGIESFRLTVAGEFWEKETETRSLIEELGLSEKVELHARYVSDQEAADFFARADATILPYRSATGSGVVALAQNYDCPMIASDIEGLNDAVKPNVNGWLFKSEDETALGNLLASEIDRNSAQKLSLSMAAEKQTLGWDKFAAAVLAAVLPATNRS